MLPSGVFYVLNSKTKNLKGKMLYKNRYKDMISLNSVKDVIGYLCSDPYYGMAFKNYDVDTLNREKVEILLNLQFAKYMSNMRNYLSGNYKSLLKELFVKYEVDDLKTIIRGIYLNKPKEKIRDLIAYRCELTTLNYDDLIECNSFYELMDKLKGTIYEKHIKGTYEHVKEDGLFSLEMALDISYFSKVRDVLNKIKQNSLMKKIIGIECDLLNIFWIYRGKKYYSLSPELIFNYAIYDHYNLTPDSIKKLCYSNDLEEFQANISNKNYKDLIQVNRDDFKNELAVFAYREREIRKVLKQNKIDFATIFSFLELYKIEIEIIVSILECKRYNHKIEDIYDLLN